MVDGLAQVLAPFLRFEGVVSAPTAPRKPLPGMKYFVGGHPIPNEESWRAAEAILALLKKCDEKTLAFFLLSGGGSALVELPLDPAQTLEDLQKMYRVLVTCGAPIYAINAVRKHLSAVKGGRLTMAAGRATKLTIAISDVPRDYESDIASGPTLPDFSLIPYVKSMVWKKKLRLRSGVGLMGGKFRRHPREKNQHSQMLTSYYCLGWTTYFIRRITRRKQEAARRVATTLLMIGRWVWLRNFCSNNWKISRVRIRGGAWR